MICELNKLKVDLETSTNGDFELYNKKTKERFYNDFVFNECWRNGLKITAGSSESEREKCYEHITTIGEMERSRIPDLRRLEAIYILKDILTSKKCKNCDNYYVWEKQEKYLKEKIFCPDTGYFIVLAKRKYVYKFVSAYIIESNNKKKRLIEEFKKFKK